MIEEILKKNPEDLTDEEKTELKESAGQLSEEDKEKFKSVLEEGSEEASDVSGAGDTSGASGSDQADPEN